MLLYTVRFEDAGWQVEFSITALDLAGNSLTVNQTNLNSLDLTIDKNVPSLTNLTLYSNNSNSSLARAGDLINITLEVSEQIYNATLQILGTEIDMTESNNTAYANITVLQNSPNGLAAFNITAYDGAGNEFNITQNDASANVIIDTANPTLSNLTIYSNNAHNTSLATLDDTLNITITANEDLSSANITILGATYTMSITGMVANASEVLCMLLLYMVRFERVGLASIDYNVCRCIILCYVKLLPAPSYAVMLNAASPFGEFCKTVMFAYAVLFDSVMSISVPRICKVAQIQLSQI